MISITSKLISCVRGEFLAENELFVNSLNRTYEYEHYVTQIPSFQRQGNFGYTPKFVKFHVENSEFHFNKMNEIFDKILQTIELILDQTEVEKKDQDYL